jgi:hypothetical protein
MLVIHSFFPAEEPKPEQLRQLCAKLRSGDVAPVEIL